jgi:hypothetical protein
LPLARNMSTCLCASTARSQVDGAAPWKYSNRDLPAIRAGTAPYSSAWGIGQFLSARHRRPILETSALAARRGPGGNER